jgi:hypothetical protein
LIEFFHLFVLCCILIKILVLRINGGITDPADAIKIFPFIFGFDLNLSLTPPPGVLVGFAYGGVTEVTEQMHSAHAQQVLFSIFVSVSVSLSYHLSRASSDPTVILSIMKRHFLAIIRQEGTACSRGYRFKRGEFCGLFLCMYNIQHCFICRPPDSTL